MADPTVEFQHAKLSSLVTGALPGSCAGLEGTSQVQQLRTFMPYAAEQTRQARHDAGSPLEMDMIRSALRLTRQVGKLCKQGSMSHL
jgi:hypothetical protein